MISLYVLTVMRARFWTLENLLKTLARKGHKVERDKIQLCYMGVEDLGNDISAIGKTTSSNQESTI